MYNLYCVHIKLVVQNYLTSLFNAGKKIVLDVVAQLVSTAPLWDEPLHALPALKNKNSYCICHSFDG